MEDRVHLFVYGAGQADIERGEAAAKACFEAVGTTPMKAAEAGFDFEYHHEASGPALTPEREKWAFAWMDAMPLAVDACLNGAEKPWFTDLIVRPDDAPPEITNDQCTAEIYRLMGLNNMELERLCKDAHEKRTLLGLLPLHVASHRANMLIAA
jgi:hypothetical protein